VSSSWQSKYKRVYIEAAVTDAPLTQAVLERVRPQQVIPLTDYREVFARAGQDFGAQKMAPALILARKKDHLVYPGNDYVQDFAYQNFAYTAQVLNCLYDCGYCYLQGMYPSAHVVIFTNQTEYFAAVDQAIASRPDKSQPLHLALSYDTDLLGFERMIPLCREWIAFTRTRPELVVEIRTKSANFSALAEIPASPQVILAWTLSPDPIIRAHEGLTPPLLRRLAAARAAQEAGWPLRLCFDPILQVDDWQELYDEMVTATFTTLDPSQVHDISLGVFRVSRDYYKKMRAQGRSVLLHSVLEPDKKSVSYPPKTREMLVAHVRARLASYFSEDQIHVWM